MLGFFCLIFLLVGGIFAQEWEYIENGKIRMGFLMESGAGIAYFSRVDKERNLLNYRDRGRLIQQSFYGNVDGSKWNTRDWVWNPVQGGCWSGTPASVEEFKNSGTEFYAKSIPRNWGGCNVLNTPMIERVRLAGDIAHIHYQFTNNDRDNKDVRGQEMPAVFVDYALPNLVYYNGSSPWTGKALTSKVPDWGNKNDNITENWAAYLDDNGWGIGVYTPGTSLITYYRFPKARGPTETGPDAGATSYFANIRKFRIPKGFTIEYDVYVYIGHVNDMRKEFQYIHENKKPRALYDLPVNINSKQGSDFSQSARGLLNSIEVTIRPTGIQLHKPFPGEVDVLIYDITGNLLREQGISHTGNFAFDFPSGLYFLQLKNVDHKVTSKFLVP